MGLVTSVAANSLRVPCAHGGAPRSTEEVSGRVEAIAAGRKVVAAISFLDGLNFVQRSNSSGALPFGATRGHASCR